MNHLQILPVDLFDREAFDAWYAAYLLAESASGAASPYQLEELRALMQYPGRRAWMGAWAGLLDDRVVTAGWLRTTLLDNLDRCELAVHTVPGARDRGYGTAMLEHVEEEARARGRSILVGESSWPYAAGPDGAGEPGTGFAAARGYALALGDVKRELRLPVADGLLEALAAEAAPYHRDFELSSFVGPVPDDLVEGWARLNGTLITEAPTGDLDVEPEHVDVGVIRQNESTLERQGRRKYNTVALDAAGEVVAYTDLATTIHEPGRAYQWGTLVRRDARGHRLGLAVKLANLRLLRAERPDIEVLTTYNAEVNTHMIGVNERLGFTPVSRLGEFQKRLR
jgi:GNAT superfamily N-acetyltransferase